MAKPLGQAAKLAVGFGVAAAVYATLAGCGHRGPRTPDEVAAAMSSDPSAAQVIPVLKQTFPKDYQTLTLTVLNDTRLGESSAEVGQAGYSLTRSLVRSHIGDIARAPDAALITLARAEAALLDRLDDPLCAKLFTAALTPADTVPDAAKPLIGDVGVANLRAARAGIDHPTERPAKPQPADALAMLYRMRAQHLEARQLDLYTGGTLMSASPHDQCALGRASFASITQLPAPQGARIMSYLISQSG